MQNSYDPHQQLQLQHAGQGANIISGTYINSSIILHNPG
jgi:hypothetical protein